MENNSKILGIILIIAITTSNAITLGVFVFINRLIFIFIKIYRITYPTKFKK